MLCPIFGGNKMGKDKQGRELGKGVSQRADGRYMARVMLDGRRVVQYFDAAKDAQNAAKDYAYLRHNGTLKIEDNITVSEWFRIWHASKATNAVVTRERDEGAYNSLIRDAIGYRPIRTIKPIDLQKLMLDIANNGYAKNTAIRVKGLLKEMFNSAVENGLIDRNPVTKSVKAQGYDPRENLIMTREQQQAFYTLCADYTMGNALIFALQTGVRVGELSGLKWSDFDADKRVISVKRSLGFDRHKQIFYEKPTKTRAGVREIPLTDIAIKCLQEQRALDNALSVTRMQYRDYIFLNSQGKPQERSNYNRILRSIKKHMELTDEEKALKFSMHTLRHTFATRNVEAGVQPKYLQTVMGHEKIEITLKYYVHATDELIRTEFDKFKALAI